MKSDRFKLAALTGLGSGLLPGAPGTWSSALAAGLWLLAALPLHSRHGLALQVGTLLAAAAAGFACVALAPWMIARTGRDDPSRLTADEFAGQWVALLWVRPMCGSLALAAAVQFVLFRVFDILKPPPCRRLERLPAGWGILADDLMAGLYANLVGNGLALAIVLSERPDLFR